MAKWSITGKTFLITGGASGLGALYAEAFLNEGAKNIAIVDIAEDLGKTTTARLNSRFPGRATFFKCDVSSEEQIAATFDQVVAKFKQLDVLINNAGIMVDTPSVWRKACDVNWQGLVSFTMKAVKHMGKNEGGAGGTIINISSIAGIATTKAIPIYSGSKAAVLHFSMSLADGDFFEVTGIRVMTICLGVTDTPLMQNLKERSYSERLGQELLDKYEEMKKVAPPQTPEAAAVACVKLFKEGAPSSVWMPVNNNPVRDITPEIKKHLDEMQKLISGQA